MREPGMWQWSRSPACPGSHVLSSTSAPCGRTRGEPGGVSRARCGRLVDRSHDRPREVERAACLQQPLDVVHVGVAVGDLRRELRIGAEAHHPLRAPADLGAARHADDHRVVRDGGRLAHLSIPRLRRIARFRATAQPPMPATSVMSRYRTRIAGGDQGLCELTDPSAAQLSRRRPALMRAASSAIETAAT